MSNDTKLVLGVILASTILLIGSVFFLSQPRTNSQNNQETNQVADFTPRDEGYNSTGAENPLVTLTEFSDFQCPACKATEPVLKQLVPEYPEYVRLVYQHYPLPQHEYARLTAEVAETAGAQGFFWQMHDLLFENQENFTQELIKNLATQIDGLNVEQFNQDLNEGKYKTTITNDIAHANKLGVNSTPTVFFNGKKLESPYSLENLKKLIEQQIELSQQIEIPTPTDSAQTEEATNSAK